MSTPIRPIPRKFYRVAYQRFEEAEVLFEAGYFIGAVYLAGYAVECMLKTLILDATPEKDHTLVETELRGQRAHQYEWLRHRYAQTNAPRFPSEIGQSLAFVRTWETSLRYTPGLGNRQDASRFLAEARKILAWQIAACSGGVWLW
jgi:HEPN domain-containing protein